MIYGYVRVSKVVDDEDYQIKKIKEFGVDRLFKDFVNTTSDNRVEFKNLIGLLNSGDSVVFYNLSKIDVTLKGVIKSANYIISNECDIISINDNINTRDNPIIKSVFNSVYLCEKDIMSQRCYAGLSKAKGFKSGRKPSINEDDKEKVKELYNVGFSGGEIAKIMKCSRSTAFKYIKEFGLSKGKKRIFNQKTYLMVNKRNNLYKIGKSNSVEYREKTLQSEEPEIHTIATCNLNIESIIHKMFKKKRVRGEWFDLETEDVLAILKIFNDPKDCISLGEIGIYF
jgi:DNA invertase Pin-like site-specific DNA recombinase